MGQFRGVKMSFNESFQVDVCHQVLRGDMPAKLAAMKLNKSYRQTLRSGGSEPQRFLRLARQAAI